MNAIIKKNVITTCAVIISSIMLAAVTKTFVLPAEILSGGFMGVAILMDMIAESMGGSFPTSIGLLLLNIPVALFCFKKISPRFVVFSLIQVVLTSFFLTVLPTYPLFGEKMLNVIFGGFLSGIAVTIALKGNASTGGTDFISLYVSNKTGKEIWTEVFAFNALMLCVFGYLYGFENAGYSILYQFVSTKTISTFHTRYKRIMLQIFTKKKDAVIEEYCQRFKHGITAIDGIGGYSKESVSMLTTIITSYEVDEVIEALQEVDPDIIINVTKSERYVGTFYTAPIE